MITLFVLEDVNGIIDPVVYTIPLDRQIEVENIAKGIWNDPNYIHRPELTFERELEENDIKFEYVGTITEPRFEERQTDWIDEKLPRVLVG